ncbi:MAG: hypothetical protein VB092_07405 [Oscillospiraceae bacterium]|nr:hypothetical protein [Oscillospiraceae bacterium]
MLLFNRKKKTPCVPKLPAKAELAAFPSFKLENHINDCFDVLRARGDMYPPLESDDLCVISAAMYILNNADDVELEDIYYLVEDELAEREVF